MITAILKMEKSMKIEMAESLCYSWLRHVKKCQLVQTNWKSSDNWIDKNSTEYQKLKDEYDNAKNKPINQYLKGEKGKDISFEQFLKQAEIDVLGFRQVKDQNKNEIYVVDVAFHKNGLKYKANDKTVAKKLIRAAFCIKAYFDVPPESVHIFFATPKINPKPLRNLLEATENVQKYIENEKNFGYHVNFIYQDKFYAEIMDPTMAASEKTSDTSELFMRAYTLWNLYTKYLYVENDKGKGKDKDKKKPLNKLKKYLEKP